MSVGSLRIPNSQTIHIKDGGNSSDLMIMGQGGFMSLTDSAKLAGSLSISLGVNAKPSVTFTPDGEVTFHEGCTVGEVAKVFWEIMAHANPLRAEVERLKKELEEERRKRVRTTRSYRHDLVHVDRPERAAARPTHHDAQPRAVKP